MNKKIILLTGSRTGSHYICNLFYNSLRVPDIIPELLNFSHWDPSIKHRRLNNTKRRFKLENLNNCDAAKHIIKNSESFIIKYWLDYDFPPEDILELKKETNTKFCFLYRKNILDTFLSNIIVTNFGYLDNTLESIENTSLKKLKFELAAKRTINNYVQINNTYKFFAEKIDKIIKYEDFKNDKNDLRLLGIDTDAEKSTIQKVVTPLLKSQIMEKYNLKEILTSHHMHIDYKDLINHDTFEYTPT